MTVADEARDNNGSDTPEGVFGNLPGTRPGIRSPRRHAGGKERPAPRAAAKPAPAPPPPPPQPEAEPPPGAEREPPVAAGTGPGQRIGSIEDLAWAGIAVAAQAATVGVRFASRALEAARKSAERP